MKIKNKTHLQGEVSNGPQIRASDYLLKLAQSRDLGSRAQAFQAGGGDRLGSDPRESLPLLFDAGQKSLTDAPHDGPSPFETHGRFIRCAMRRPGSWRSLLDAFLRSGCGFSQEQIRPPEFFLDDQVSQPDRAPGAGFNRGGGEGKIFFY